MAAPFQSKSESTSQSKSAKQKSNIHAILQHSFIPQNPINLIKLLIIKLFN